VFDVSAYRALTERQAFIREVMRPTLVLGGAQRADLVDGAGAARSGTEVWRRRGGGGAVLLQPGDHLWIEAWIPRADPLWHPDVSVAAEWVGEWWAAALGEADAAPSAMPFSALDVQRGRAHPGSHGSLVCFAGSGPGEVFARGRKVVGVSQWRAREGSLFLCCAYTRWDPFHLIALLAVDPVMRRSLEEQLPLAAIDLAELGIAAGSGAALAARLQASLGGWAL
jgi:lipoate-protein ligase A